MKIKEKKIKYIRISEKELKSFLSKAFIFADRSFQEIDDYTEHIDNDIIDNMKDFILKDGCCAARTAYIKYNDETESNALTLLFETSAYFTYAFNKKTGKITIDWIEDTFCGSFSCATHEIVFMDEHGDIYDEEYIFEVLNKCIGIYNYDEENNFVIAYYSYDDDIIEAENFIKTTQDKLNKLKPKIKDEFVKIV